MTSEIRYAVRQLLKAPGFTLVAIIGLALGIGANVALFSVVDAVFLRPLPYPDADRVVRLSSTDESKRLIRVGFSYSRYLAVQQTGQQVFSDLAVSIGNPFTLTGTGAPEQLIGLQASATLLPTLGLEPRIGRNFSASEDQPGGEHVVLLSYTTWRQRFNGDPSVLGQSLTLEGAPYTIIGVLPESASAFPLNQIQVWVPRPKEVSFLIPSQVNTGYFFQVIARLRPGVSLAQAREAMKVVEANYRAANPGNLDAPSQIEVVPILEDAVGNQRQAYLMLFAAVGCVLLIACANIANLQLARFAGRRREIAARFALGASRIDVVRQLVSESVLVAVLGGAVGLLLADWALSAVVSFGADLIPRAAEIRIDRLALGFALLTSVVTGLMIGVLPAWHAAQVNVLDALKEAGRGSIGSRDRVRAGLLIAEVSLSLVLLIAAGLLLTSFARLQRVNPGFEPAGVFTAQLALPPSRYDRQKLVTFYEQFYQRLKALPNSTSAALTDRVPLTGGQAPAPVAVVGRPLPPLSERPAANRHLISPGYFKTLGIPLRAGRDFDERDSSTVPHVVIINETFARRFMPGEDPIGRTLVTGMAQLPSQIVGVVADIRSSGLNAPPDADYFLPALQRPEAFTNILVRTNVSAAAMTPVVREALRSVDADLPLLQPEALTTRIAQTIADRKLALRLLEAFAVLALVIAALGVYSVMAHLVAFRTSEIGLRMALGASPGTVMRMVLGHGRRLTLVGIAIGIAGALVVSRLMQQVLFEVKPADPVVYIGLSIALLAVTELASWFPARRATRIDPAIALRMD